MTAVDDYLKEIERLTQKMGGASEQRAKDFEAAITHWQCRIDDLMRPVEKGGDAYERDQHPELAKDK
jgi:hypothetical protein